MAAKTENKYTPVSVENNKTKELDFVFKPDGEIRGCLTTALKPEDKFAGSPGIRYRSSDTTIHIQSICLKSKGIHRILTHTTGPEVDSFEYLIMRNDGCHNNCFVFFGLPAGDYTLSLKA